MARIEPQRIEAGPFNAVKELKEFQARYGPDEVTRNQDVEAEPSSYRVVGSTSDGVKILAPETKPTHFTSGEIRETIERVRREDVKKNVAATLSQGRGKR